MKSKSRPKCRLCGNGWGDHSAIEKACPIGAKLRGGYFLAFSDTERYKAASNNPSPHPHTKISEKHS